MIKRICDICSKELIEKKFMKNGVEITHGDSYNWKAFRLYDMSLSDVCPQCHKEIADKIMELINEKKKQ